MIMHYTEIVNSLCHFPFKNFRIKLVLTPSKIHDFQLSCWSMNHIVKTILSVSTFSCKQIGNYWVRGMSCRLSNILKTFNWTNQRLWHKREAPKKFSVQNREQQLGRVYLTSFRQIIVLLAWCIQSVEKSFINIEKMGQILERYFKLCSCYHLNDYIIFMEGFKKLRGRWQNMFRMTYE